VYHFSKVVVYSVKENLYKTIRSSDYRLFEEKKQGELINIFMSGPSSITSSIETLMTLIADITLSGMIALSLYFVSDFGLLVLIIGGFLFYLVNAKVGGAVSRELGQLSYDSGMSENVIISEYISGIRAIRASNSTMFWENNAKKAILLYWDRYSEAKYLQRLPGLLIYSLFLLAIGFIILILFHFFQEGFSLVLPVVGAFAIGTLRIVPKLSAIGFEHLQLINGSIYVRSVYDFLTDNKYQNVQNGMISFENLNDDIIFHDVVFSYGHTPVLRGLSLTLKKGMVTAIVGPSGAGKSTITGLLLRLYDPDTGHILLNNKDFKEYEIGSLLNHVGYVGQEPFVFNASIRDNITFGIDYSDKEVYRAASLAHAHDFIEKLPDGYSTVIGDRGMKLSGGEKQRVVIARAMIRRPELLILDEATSSLDNISEALVQEAIDEVSKGCTTLVIAHRLTTIQKADWIYVIDGGEVIEEGKHEELMEQRGLYWGMYMRTLIDR
jgi:ABC-type multidrug transport system fused ATPase/permease subunit